jgi:hypothetical protein
VRPENSNFAVRTVAKCSHNINANETDEFVFVSDEQFTSEYSDRNLHSTQKIMITVFQQIKHGMIDEVKRGIMHSFTASESSLDSVVTPCIT